MLGLKNEKGKKTKKKEGMIGGAISYLASLNNSKFLKLLNKTKIAISSDDTRHYLNGIFLHLTEDHGRNFLTGVAVSNLWDMVKNGVLPLEI